MPSQISGLLKKIPIVAVASQKRACDCLKTHIYLRRCDLEHESQKELQGSDEKLHVAEQNLHLRSSHEGTLKTREDGARLFK